MQLLWFLPSIAYGVMLAVTSASYLLLASTLLSAGAMILVRWRQSMQPKLGDDTRVRVFEARIWLDDYRLPRGSAFWSREQFDFVWQKLSPNQNLFQELVSTFIKHEYQTTQNNLAATIGFSTESLVEISLVDDGPHAIVIGATGSGKTQLLKKIVSELHEFDSLCELVLIDFKGGSGLGKFSSFAKALVSDQDLLEAQRVFELLQQELISREQGSAAAQPMVIVVDELAHLLASVKTAESVLSNIAARGRSARMHLVLTNQNLVGVPRALLSNLKLRILVGQPDPVDAALLGQSTKSETPPDCEQRLAGAQIVGHGQAAKMFWYPLPARPKPQRLPEPLGREPGLRLRSTTDPREYLVQGLERRRRGRHLANRGRLLHAHKEVSH